MPVAVVTDSSASLPDGRAEAAGLTVVPLQVVIGGQSWDETDEAATPEAVAAALREFVPVSTSRPAPAVLAQTYERLAAQGHDAIVSVHLSGDMSGTVESARLAAKEVGVRVLVVDSRQVGAATGFAALDAAEVAAVGGTAEEAADAAVRRADAAVSLFYVDTLEYLRRGGRVGAAAALLGSALAVKPLLTIVDGRVQTREKVRTATRALARLEELAVEAAGEGPVDVCISHLSSPDRADQLAEHLRERLAENLDGREAWTGELGAALGAHVGPGMVSVCVCPRTLG